MYQRSAEHHWSFTFIHLQAIRLLRFRRRKTQFPIQHGTHLADQHDLQLALAHLLSQTSDERIYRIFVRLTHPSIALDPGEVRHLHSTRFLLDH
jgi:hypothetical protein